MTDSPNSTDSSQQSRPYAGAHVCATVHKLSVCPLLNEKEEEALEGLMEEEAASASMPISADQTHRGGGSKGGGASPARPPLVPFADFFLGDRNFGAASQTLDASAAAQPNKALPNQYLNRVARAPMPTGGDQRRSARGFFPFGRNVTPEGVIILSRCQLDRALCQSYDLAARQALLANLDGVRIIATEVGNYRDVQGRLSPRDIERGLSALLSRTQRRALMRGLDRYAILAIEAAR